MTPSTTSSRVAMILISMHLSSHALRLCQACIKTIKDNGPHQMVGSTSITCLIQSISQVGKQQLYLIHQPHHGQHPSDHPSHQWRLFCLFSLVFLFFCFFWF